MRNQTPNSRSESARLRLIHRRHPRSPSAQHLPPTSHSLYKGDMMTRTKPEEEKKPQEQSPAVHPDAQGTFLAFRPLFCAKRPPAPPASGFNFKFFGSEPKLVRWVLEDNGFRENKKDWLIGWSSTSFRSNVFQSLNKFQKVNHFPRTHEITKKDSLFKNVSKMQTLHGKKHFDFVPCTFVLPQELKEFTCATEQEGGSLWIVKPAGSSQGRGIFLTSEATDIPPRQCMVASQYIANPLLINGLKFDLRVYVALTSLDPLRVYVYKEGLVRFATESYNLADPSNPFVHLTNYSLNKHSPAFQDLGEDGKGFKWTNSALRTFFQQQNIPFEGIWTQIKDIVLKTVIAAEATMNAGMSMFVPFKANCFELLGFDILIDDTLRPWLLEVNLSPSLNTESKVDLKVKSPLLSDLFTLIGVTSIRSKHRKKQIAQSLPDWASHPVHNPLQLSKSELRAVRETHCELQRCGNFECLFPGPSSIVYKKYFEAEKPLNSLLMAHYAVGMKRELHQNQLQSYELKLGHFRRGKRRPRSPRFTAAKLRSLSKPRVMEVSS